MSNPPVKITRAVDERDGEACVRCGVSLHTVTGSRHHRQRRAVGGHTVENIITLCGSGTTGCHGWAHANPANARAAGYIIPANGKATPEVIPVLVRWLGAQPFQSHVWVILGHDGDTATRLVIPPAEAQELLYTFGLISLEVA